MKMSDVWNQPITYGIYENASVAGNVLPMGFGMLFNNEEPARAIVHAVSNHDRMVEEIAELSGALREARVALSTCSIQESRNDGSENRMKINALDKQVCEIDSLLAKLNKND